ncbi:methyltransferase [Aspergillus ellipticus CBS 707.79]|uniref:Methyltransferase n=1 Tax=Aspergillus ellipticus CBS 707.79 TaxID=1448320 RepID=A0A319CVD4_9EURO|nr:methyltransferase [Aspergillus ellipticus CBS 707.79]PYH88750.1 methyltransferase [Aspergillus ellipticus CBS 707.79]
MPRTDEAEWWFNAVYEAVQEIPRGRITSYGHIALLLGYPKRPRQVGVTLKHLPQSSSEHFFHEANVPWQRVINSRGMISHRGPGSAERQAEALRAEGVQVDVDAMGEFYVDVAKFGWFPEMLPSEEGLDSDLGGEDGDGDGEGQGEGRGSAGL